MKKVAVISQDLNKSNLLKAIEFLKSIPSGQWTKCEQTKDFDPKNIGKSHCFIGHLAVNPASPFYDEKLVSPEKTEIYNKDHFAFTLNRLPSLSTPIHRVNNDPSLNGSKTSKAAVMKVLKKLTKEIK